MSRLYALFGGFFVLLSMAVPAMAHHSFTAEFDGSKELTITGTLTKIDWINPHVYLYMDVKDPSGKVANWTIETVPTGFLHRTGITRDQFVIGQTLVIEGYHAKDEAKPFISTKSITFPDGHKYVIYVSQNP